MEVEDILIDTLKQLGFPVHLQGSLADNEDYPPTFFTFWNNDSEGTAHYDNKEHAIVYDYDVNIYSSNQEYVYSKLREAIEKLRKKGFIISGDGYSVISDEPTHDGRGVNVLYIKRR